MQTTQHTPAPWKHDEVFGLIKYGKTEICALHSGNIANAKLIAASPDMLEALEYVLAIITAPDCPRIPDAAFTRGKIVNAIRKAKGGE